MDGLLEALNDKRIISYHQLLQYLLSALFQGKKDSGYTVSDFDLKFTSDNETIETVTVAKSITFDINTTLHTQGITLTQIECPILSLLLPSELTPDVTFNYCVLRAKVLLAQSCANYLIKHANIGGLSSELTVDFPIHLYLAQITSSDGFPHQLYLRYLKNVTKSAIISSTLTLTKKPHPLLVFRLTRTQLPPVQLETLKILVALILPKMKHGAQYQITAYNDRDGVYIGLNTDDPSILGVMANIQRTPSSTRDPWRYINVPREHTDSECEVPKFILDIYEFLQQIKELDFFHEVLPHYKSVYSKDPNLADITLMLYQYYFMKKMIKDMPEVPNGSYSRTHVIPFQTEQLPHQRNWSPNSSPIKVYMRLIKYLEIRGIKTIGIKDFNKQFITSERSYPGGLQVDCSSRIMQFLISKTPLMLLEHMPRILKDTKSKLSFSEHLEQAADGSAQVNPSESDNIISMVGIAVWLSKLSPNISDCFSLLYQHLSGFLSLPNLLSNLKVFGVDPFLYSLTMDAIVRIYDAQTWTEEQAQKLSPLICRFIFSLQPSTRTDWLLHCSHTNLASSGTLLDNSLIIIRRGHSNYPWRIIIKAGYGKKQFLEETLANRLRDIVLIPHRVSVGRVDKPN